MNMTFTSQCVLFWVAPLWPDIPIWMEISSVQIIRFQMFSASDLAWVNVSQCLGDHLAGEARSQEETWESWTSHILNILTLRNLTLFHSTWNKDPCFVDGSTCWGFFGCSHCSFTGIGVAGWRFKYIGGITKPHQRYKLQISPKPVLPAVWILWLFINHQKQALITENGILMILWLWAGSPFVPFQHVFSVSYINIPSSNQPTSCQMQRFFCTWKVAMIGKWSDDGRPLNKLVSTSKSINFKEPLQSIQSICPWIIPWRVIGHFECKVTDGL